MHGAYNVKLKDHILQHIIYYDWAAATALEKSQIPHSEVKMAVCGWSSMQEPVPYYHNRFLRILSKMGQMYKCGWGLYRNVVIVQSNK